MTSDLRTGLTRASALVAMALLVATVVQAQMVDPVSDPIEFELEETSGERRTARSARGRVVFLFYEDRDHAQDNHEFKASLHRFVVDNHLEDQTRTFAIACVTGIAEGVIRDIARGAIRTVAAQYNIQILIDWDGLLARPPLSFHTTGANTAILDRQGRLRWRHHGTISAAESTSFYRTTRQLLREPAP